MEGSGRAVCWGQKPWTGNRSQTLRDSAGHRSPSGPPLSHWEREVTLKNNVGLSGEERNGPQQSPPPPAPGHTTEKLTHARKGGKGVCCGTVSISGKGKRKPEHLSAEEGRHVDIKLRYFHQ